MIRFDTFVPSDTPPDEAATTVGAVLRAVGASLTVVPAVAFARDADAPEIVAALPTFGVELHCSVEAVAPFAVTQTENSSSILIGPPLIVKMVVPFTMTAAADSMIFSEASQINGIILFPSVQCV